MKRSILIGLIVALFASLFTAYVLNNMSRIPNAIWFMLPAYIWANVSYYITLPLASFVLVGVPCFILTVLSRQFFKKDANGAR
jgi:hypothetical protein